MKRRNFLAAIAATPLASILLGSRSAPRAIPLTVTRDYGTTTFTPSGGAPRFILNADGDEWEYRDGRWELIG